MAILKVGGCWACLGHRMPPPTNPNPALQLASLQVHSRGKTLGKDVDFEKIARRTPGFTGADLANLMNEAAILAARRNLKEISKVGAGGVVVSAWLGLVPAGGCLAGAAGGCWRCALALWWLVGGCCIVGAG